jgi:GNAT superfamily N-acetyltransferase
MHHAQRDHAGGWLAEGIPGPEPIQAADLGMVCELIDRCYQEYGLRLNLDDECEQHLRDPGSYFRAGGGEFWVARDETGTVRATAALHVHAAADGGARVGELKSMYVDHAGRRRGVGRALTRHVMEAARRAGCSAMELWSDTRFEAAHRMYESLGFERFGERDIVDSNSSREFGYRRAL